MDPAWIQSARRDAVVAWCWVPFAVVTRVAEQHGSALGLVLSAVLLLSLSHQPLTLGLVYGDRSQFRSHARLFTFAPALMVVAVVVGLRISFLMVAVIAGLWNAEHTLMQRYGITRIYGRKVGDDHGRQERAALFAWLGLVLVAAAANRATPAALAHVDVGEVNRRAIRLLASLRPQARAMVPVALAAVAVLTARWVSVERGRVAAGARVNPAKYVYLSATVALFIVMCIDPVAGFAGYVGAHALEYDSIVHAALGRRAASGDAGWIGRLARRPGGRIVFFLATVVGVTVPMLLFQRYGSFTPATAMFLVVGGLHFVFDSVIWKLRRPAVARSLGVPVAVA